jgi:hypothetical protein
MKSEWLINHNPHIMYTLQLLSYVLCTLRSVPITRVFCTNLHPASKLLITIDLLSSSMIPSLAHSSINTSNPTCFSFTFRVCALSGILLASLESFCCGKVDCHRLCCESFHSICRISFIFNHGFKLVGFQDELLHRTIILLAVKLPSSEFFPIMLNFFPHLNSLSRNKYLSALPPRQNFMSCFPTMMSLLLSFITMLISFYIKIFHRASRSYNELLELFFLITQSFYHCHSDRSL